MSEDLIKLRALHSIFEKHLYDLKAEHASQNDLIEQVVHDYKQFLVTQKIAVPKRWERDIETELREQVRTMIRKTIYGAMTPKEFVQNKKKEVWEKRKNAIKKFFKLY